MRQPVEICDNNYYMFSVWVNLDPLPAGAPDAGCMIEMGPELAGPTLETSISSYGGWTQYSVISKGDDTTEDVASILIYCLNSYAVVHIDNIQFYRIGY